MAGAWCLGEAAEGPCLTLTADGRFRDDGALRVLEHATYPYPLSLPRGAGTFESRENTLLFRYDNGAEFRLSLPGAISTPAGKPPQIWLSFNFDVLTRR